MLTPFLCLEDYNFIGKDYTPRKGCVILMKTSGPKRHLSPSQIILLGFFILILVGSLLLMLPVATRHPGGASFSDALFTATSAACVTGLVVQDTATYWSSFGQVVILALIQVGGMGVITFAVTITMISGRKIGLMQRSTLQEAISAPQMGGIVRLTNFVLKTVVVIELTGAVLMAPTFCREFGVPHGLWYSVFHSVSAFCNAGFDLMGSRQAFSSLTFFAQSPVINLTIMALIVTGGIGFLTWDDIRSNGYHLKHYRMQSKVILSVTGFLIAAAAVFYFFHEYSAFPLGERIWVSLFQAITPRTAGFNTTDLGTLSETGRIVTILLMLIGGSPGSTAGGMKTTTVAVLIFSAAAAFRRREDAQCFGRRISPVAVRNAMAVMLMYLTAFLVGGILIGEMDGIPVLTCLFEAASAIGTVGLTLGITPDLSLFSQGILVALMFFGRVGGLTLVFATFTGTHPCGAKLPQEKITVG